MVGFSIDWMRMLTHFGWFVFGILAYHVVFRMIPYSISKSIWKGKLDAHREATAKLGESIMAASKKKDQ